MQLNYNICKHFYNCPHDIACIYEQPHKPYYPCIEYTNEEARKYLNSLVKLEPFRYNLRFHLFNWLRTNYYKVPNAKHLYYHLEKDSFFMTAIPLEELISDGAVKDQLNLKHHYYEIPIDFDMLLRIDSAYDIGSFNSNKKSNFHQAIDSAVREFAKKYYILTKELF